MAITYSEAIDANDERRGRAREAASRAAKSVELASLQSTRSFTYLALNSSLFAIGFWSQLATAFSIRLLEREVEIGQQLADIFDNRPMKHSPPKAERAIAAGPTIGETAQELAMAAEASIQEAVRKAADGADQLAARMDDTADEVVATGNDAAQTIAAVADDSKHSRFTEDGAPALVTTTEGDQEIELRAERLVINKQRRQNGEARVRKEIVTEKKSIDVPVSHEEIVIDRQAVTGDVDCDSAPIADETIRIPLTEEQVDITKETVVREEVEIGTRRIEDIEHISDTVRHEELRADDAPTNHYYEPAF